MEEIIATINNYKIINDKEKGYIHCDPIPSENELNLIYENEYHKEDQNGYVGRNIEDLDWWQTLYKDKYETFDENLNHHTRVILDIGCGAGDFLLYGKQLGWDCYGVEPSKAAANYAKKNGLNIINKNFNKKLFDKHKLFDVVHMHHVLEHISEPVQLINDASELLSDHGIFCVAVPNDFSPFQKILSNDLGMKPWWLAPPHHINYFTPDTLCRLLEKNGFEIIKKESSFPMELFLMLGDNYVEDPSLGRKMHNKRKKFDMILSQFDNQFKRDLYQAFANLNIGRDIIVYAKKS